jgi:hypothetical protein
VVVRFDFEGTFMQQGNVMLELRMAHVTMILTTRCKVI